MLNCRNVKLITDSLCKSWKSHFNNILYSWPIQRNDEFTASDFIGYFKKFKNYFDQNKTKVYSIVFADILQQIYDIIFNSKQISIKMSKLVLYTVSTSYIAFNVICSQKIAQNMIRTIQLCDTYLLFILHTI